MVTTPGAAHTPWISSASPIPAHNLANPSHQTAHKSAHNHPIPAQNYPRTSPTPRNTRPAMRGVTPCGAPALWAPRRRAECSGNLLSAACIHARALARMRAKARSTPYRVGDVRRPDILFPPRRPFARVRSVFCLGAGLPGREAPPFRFLGVAHPRKKTDAGVNRLLGAAGGGTPPSPVGVLACRRISLGAVRDIRLLLG